MLSKRFVLENQPPFVADRVELLACHHSVAIVEETEKSKNELRCEWKDDEQSR